MKSTAWFLLLGLVLPSFTARSQKPSAKGQREEEFLFEIQPHEVVAGEKAVLRWSIQGATKVTIEEAAQSRGGRVEVHKLGTFEGSSGTLEVTPTTNTTYLINCEGSSKYSCASLTVRVRVKDR